MNFIYTDLKWDTNYFGVECGRIDIQNELNLLDLKLIKGKIEKKKFLTITNPKSMHKNNFYIATETKAYLVDINVHLLIDKIAYENSNKENINIENNKNIDKEIIRIAQNSFVNSRFINDINISDEKASDLYANWVNNSFDKINKYFITFTENKEIGAFLLFSINEEIATIELIAVDEKFRGKGIGFELINDLKKFSIDNNIKKISVGTQIENIKAINFYEKCDFKIDDIKYIYHVWS